MVPSLKISDAMTSEPITVGPDTPFKEMVDLMIHHDIGAVPVVDSEGSLLGIVTETDLLTKPAFGDERPKLRTRVRALLAGEQNWLRKAPGSTASEIMTAPVQTIAPTELLSVAARRLVEHRIGRLPVVDDQGQLIGIVSRRDLLRPFDRSDDDIAADIQATLDDPMVFERRPQVSFSVDDGRATLTGTVDFPHNVIFVHDVVGNIPGVVGVDNQVTAELPEPRPEGPTIPPSYPGL